MSEWRARRFWARAEVVPVEGGATVHLDGRPIRTPLKAPVVMPTEALARGVALEWAAQGDAVDPLSMPLMRAVNATLDKVIPQQREVVASLAEYGGADLLCYRATGPDDLVRRQAEAWDPWLRWARDALGAPLVTTRGVIPVPQPRASLAALRARVAAFAPWEVTALSEFVSLTGSLVLGLAVMDGEGAEAIWPLGRIDEDWQAEEWGVDEEAAERAAARREAFMQAERYLRLVRA